MLCVQDKTCKFFLPLSVITQVINLLKMEFEDITYNVLSNKVGQNNCSLILKNNHCKFSVICVRFMYKYLALCNFFPIFLILRRLSFLKTFLVTKDNQHNKHMYSMVWHFFFKRTNTNSFKSRWNILPDRFSNGDPSPLLLFSFFLHNRSHALF